MKKEGAVVYKKLVNILTGWGKTRGWIPVTSAEEKMQELRMEKCRHCFHSKESSVLKILKDTARNESVLQCTKCSCPCEEKTIVVSETCPLEKW